MSSIPPNNSISRSPSEGQEFFRSQTLGSSSSNLSRQRITAVDFQKTLSVGENAAREKTEKLVLPDLGGFVSSSSKRKAPPAAPNARLKRLTHKYEEQLNHPLHLIKCLQTLPSASARYLGKGEYFTVYSFTQSEWKIIENAYIYDKKSDFSQINFLRKSNSTNEKIAVKVMHKVQTSRATKSKLEFIQGYTEKLFGILKDQSIQIPQTEIYPDKGVIIQEYLPEKMFSDEEKNDINTSSLEDALSPQIQVKLGALRTLISLCIQNKIPLDLSFDNLRANNAGKWFLSDPVEENDGDEWYIQLNTTLREFVKFNPNLFRELLIEDDVIISTHVCADKDSSLYEAFYPYHT